MTDRPTDGAMLPCPFCGEDAKSIAIRDGRQVFCLGCHAKGPPAYHGPANIPPTQKRAIDGWNYREAVAPAVRNLVAILARIQKRAKANPSDTDEDRKRDLYHIESLASQGLSRYRHLIEESEQ